MLWPILILWLLETWKALFCYNNHYCCYCYQSQFASDYHHDSSYLWNWMGHCRTIWGFTPRSVSVLIGETAQLALSHAKVDPFCFSGMQLMIQMSFAARNPLHSQVLTFGPHFVCLISFHVQSNLVISSHRCGLCSAKGVWVGGWVSTYHLTLLDNGGTQASESLQCPRIFWPRSGEKWQSPANLQLLKMGLMRGGRRRVGWAWKGVLLNVRAPSFSFLPSRDKIPWEGELGGRMQFFGSGRFRLLKGPWRHLRGHYSLKWLSPVQWW